MDKVYIVTHGEYSDYGIEGVFSTKENAQEYIKLSAKKKASKFPSWSEDPAYYEKEEFNIEEYNIDTKADKVKQGLILYEVRMLQNGEVISVYDETFSQGGVNNFYIYTLRKDTILRNRCWAKDEQHAIKITNELRTGLIARNQFISMED